MPAEPIVGTSHAAKRGLEAAVPGATSFHLESTGSPGFDDVFAAEQRALVALAFSLTGSMTAAEDLAQEALLRLHQRWSRVATYERPGAWLRRVVLNLATSRARRLAAETRAITRLGRERRPDPGLTSEAADFWSAVRGLPRRQAQVLALYYGEDCSVAEVAEILRCAEGTVRAHLHQGRQTLSVRLGPEDREGTAQ